MAQVERAVLELVLEHHPAQLSTREIVRALTDRPEDFGSRDAVLTALRLLVSSGLLHDRRGFWAATVAAAEFDQLLGGR